MPWNVFKDKGVREQTVTAPGDRQSLSQRKHASQKAKRKDQVAKEKFSSIHARGLKLHQNALITPFFPRLGEMRRFLHISHAEAKGFAYGFCIESRHIADLVTTPEGKRTTF